MDSNSQKSIHVAPSRHLDGGQVGDGLGLGDLGDDLVVRKHADLEVLGADDELVPAVLVVVGEDEGGHVVPGHGPERVVALVVESLQRAVAAHDGQGSAGAANPPWVTCQASTSL